MHLLPVFSIGDTHLNNQALWRHMHHFGFFLQENTPHIMHGKESWIIALQVDAGLPFLGIGGTILYQPQFSCISNYCEAYIITTRMLLNLSTESGKYFKWRPLNLTVNVSLTPLSAILWYFGHNSGHICFKDYCYFRLQEHKNLLHQTTGPPNLQSRFQIVGS